MKIGKKVWNLTIRLKGLEKVWNLMKLSDIWKNTKENDKKVMKN